jgi:hypothetical protein
MVDLFIFLGIILVFKGFLFFNMLRENNKLKRSNSLKTIKYIPYERFIDTHRMY